ncbi:PTS sugar transporter subunit IIC [Longimicrobium sp.]|uniref:PTS sugar transporter subunit IIC n=1 Tax=Longimicrobium sp. TaxID=2029185 RepID=UPI002B698774|nr:PTS sugar transporter subunit IIC [Longimicrobium sp.]HSU14985.1 PTS sugar transporter subunit IIC [Longimicrobium sp.]
MIPTAAQTAVLALLGGLVALDGTSVGQFMVSRPFVAAALGGLAVGRPMLGIQAGIVLEALHLAVLPVGAAKYPEGGPASVAVGGVFAASQSPPVAASATLLVAVLVALALEWVGGYSVERMRQFNVRFAGSPPEGVTPREVARRHLTPVAVDFARGAVLTLVGVGVLDLLLGTIDFSGFPEIAVGTVVRLAVVAGVASALRLFGRGNYPFFLAGAAAGAAVAWLR